MGKKKQKGETSLFAPERRAQTEVLAQKKNLFPHFPNFYPALFGHCGRLSRRPFLAPPPLSEESRGGGRSLGWPVAKALLPRSTRGGRGESSPVARAAVFV